jgi:NAD(P)-dependent dehydrogenase (short-subunit alcohol dehydrogenase family)
MSILSRSADSRTDLRDKVIAITGAARGIGFTTATLLHERGARVAIGDIDGDAVGKAGADLGCPAFELDVTSAESFRDFLDRVEKEHGPLDVLVNNAGIMPVGPISSYGPAMIRRNFEINLIGVATGSMLAAERMVARGSGHIVNIASVAGRLPVPGLTIYNGAKAGVLAFSEALNLELGDRGVRVSTVSPTFTRTALISGIQTNKLIRTIDPDTVAARVMRTIEKPKVHATAPDSMAWVHANAIIPQRLKRASTRWTGLDRMFMTWDSDERADYDKRISR